MTAGIGDDGSASPLAPAQSEAPPYKRWGRSALFLTALFLAMVASRDVLLRPVLLLLLGPESTGRVVGIAWTLPSLLVLPLAYLSDRVPRRESRRQLYLLFAGLLSVGAWGCLPLVPLAVGPLTAIALVLGCAAALISVSVRGGLVEAARPLAATGRLAAGLAGVQATAALFELPVLRRLMERPLEGAAAAGIALGLALALLVGWSLVGRRASSPMSTTQRPAAGLRDYLRSRAFWALLALGTLVALATPDYFLYLLRPTDAGPLPYELRLHGNFVAKAARLVAPVAYALACLRLAPRTLLPVALAIAALGVCDLLVASRGTSPAFEIGMAASGFGQSLAFVALLDLTFRAAPDGHEAFAVTLTAFGPAVVAPAVHSVWFARGLALSTDVAIGVGCLLLAIAGRRLVPADLLDTADGQANVAATTRP